MCKVTILLLFAALSAQAQSPVAIEIHPEKPGSTIPEDFLGLSFETSSVLPKPDGRYLFRPDNSRLIRLFQTLGIKSLRIGGNTADRSNVKIPAGADFDNLFSFASRAGVQVIYTLRLKDSSAGEAANTARYLVGRHKEGLDCLAIGNEPDKYFSDYSAYRGQLEKFMDAIVALPHASGIKFCGPATTPAKPEWARGLANDPTLSGRMRWITQHAYPGGSARKVQDPAAARRTLLSPEFQKSYENFYQAFAPEISSHGLGYRLEETNNFFHGGAADVSDTFASALWALDYLYWWASHGAQGLNFHTGDNVAAGETQTASRYAAFWASNAGYSVHPLGYGLKAFDLGAHGRLLPVDFVANRDGIHLTAYAVRGGRSVFITLINKEEERAAVVDIPLPASYTQAQEMLLSAPKNDISAKSGITLGGAPITDEGRWSGAWSSLPRPSSDRKLSINLPPATAAVIKLIGTGADAP